jgi:hypothetical protein
MLLANAVVSDFGQVAIYAGAAIVASGITAMAIEVMRRKRDHDSDRKKIDTIYVALIGAQSTPLDPHPTPGLIDRVEEYHRSNIERKQLGDAIIARVNVQEDVVQRLDKAVEALTQGAIEHNTMVRELKGTVETLAGSVSEVKEDVKVLLADTTTNGGSTTRDAIKRIEGTIGSSPEGKGEDK